MKALALFFVIFSIFKAQAAIKTEAVQYFDGKTALEGYLAYDDTIKSPRPVVMIVHQWKGLGDYEKSRAQQIAEKGYVAFAIDIYGKGVRATNSDEAGKLAGIYKNNRTLYRQREKVALDFISKDKRVDTKRVIAIGYCFGGMGVLEMGRAGFPLAGIVTFHGDLSNPNPSDAKNIKGKVAVFHGAIDPFVDRKQVDGFLDEMNTAKVDFQFSEYSGAVHAFTDKSSGNDIKAGVAYNAEADRRSWQAFTDFLNEVAPVINDVM